MKDFLAIKDVNALEVLDSRGNPTVQVEVVVDGAFQAWQLYHLEHLQGALKL